MNLGGNMLLNQYPQMIPPWSQRFGGIINSPMLPLVGLLLGLLFNSLFASSVQDNLQWLMD